MKERSVTLKKTGIKDHKKRQAIKITKRISLLFAELLSSLLFSFTRLCYKKRKTLSATFLVASFFFVMVISYKYVQAKMDETDSFSDTYILEKVSKHIPLPSEKPLSLVRVEDPAALQKENPFYAKVKEGDYIIAYQKLFIIYDAVHDEIEGVKESSRKE